MSNRYDYPVPIYLGLKNFMSHVNTSIDFGDPDQNVFINGASGRGKSGIQRALQLALGKKISEPNKIFHYTEIDVGEKEKKREYCKSTEIILKLKNCGITPIASYPINAVITIRCLITQNGVKGNNVDIKNVRRKYWVTSPSGTEEKKYARDIQIFGRGDDPLIFIPQRETRKNVEVDPRIRFENMEKFIGAKQFREKVRLASNKLAKAREEMEKGSDLIKNMRIQLGATKKDFDRFQQKKQLIETINQKQLNFKIADLNEIFALYQEKEAEFSTLDDEINKFTSNREMLNKRIQSLENDIREQKISTEDKQKKRTKLEDRIDALSEITYGYETSKKEILTRFSKFNIDPKNIPPKETIDENLAKTKYSLNRNIGTRVQVERERELLQVDLQKLMNNKVVIPKKAEIFAQILEKNKIPFQFLFQSVDLKEGCEIWQPIIESAFGKKRFAIIVKEEDRIAAQKLNQKNQAGASLLYSIHKLAEKRRPHKDIRSWHNILKVITTQLPSKAIENALDLSFGGNYFAKTFDEKEKFLKVHPWIRIYCLDKFSYTNYSQDSIFFVRDRTIGKGAVQYEIQRISQEIESLTYRQKSLLKEEQDLDSQKKKNIAMSDYQKLIQDEQHYLDSKNKSLKFKESVKKLNAELAYPEEMLKTKETRLKEVQGEFQSNENHIQENQNESNTIQSDLSALSKSISEKYAAIMPNEDIEEISSNIQDEKINYRAIDIEKFIPLLEKFPIPQKLSVEISAEIKATNSIIEISFSDVSEETEVKYKKQNEAIDRQEMLLTQFGDNLEECTSEYIRTDQLLREQLRQWQTETGNIFKNIMHTLELDGNLEFNAINEKGDYEMNIKVANSIGGALVNYEDSGFSGGEQQRTAVALMMALLSKSNYTYTIWDEFDSEVDESKRELIAIALQKYLPNRKIIGISPKNMSKGYIRVFPNLFEIWKNQNNESQISKFTETAYFGDRRTLDADL